MNVALQLLWFCLSFLTLAKGVVIDNRSYRELHGMKGKPAAMMACYGLMSKTTLERKPSECAWTKDCTSSNSRVRRSLTWTKSTAKPKCAMVKICKPATSVATTTVSRAVITESLETLDPQSYELKSPSHNFLREKSPGGVSVYECVWRVCAVRPKLFVVDLPYFKLHSPDRNSSRCIVEWINFAENIDNIGRDTKECGYQLDSVAYTGEHRCLWIVYKTNNDDRVQHNRFTGYYAAMPLPKTGPRHGKPKADADVVEALTAIYTQHADPCCFTRNQKVYAHLTEMGFYEEIKLRRARKKAERVCTCPKQKPRHGCLEDTVNESGSGSGSGVLNYIPDEI